MAVKLLYADSNTVGPVSEVRPHTLPVYEEELPPTIWQTVKPKYRNVSNRVGETEVQQITESVLTQNRYEVLSNLPEHVPSVSSPCHNRRMDLFVPSATKLRTKSQRYMAKHPKYHHHRMIQQEVPTTKIEYEESNHLSCDPKHYQIPVIINGHVNSPLLRRDKKLFNRDGALIAQKTLGKATMKKDVRKVVILGDSHARGLSDRLNDKLMNSFEVIGYTKPNCDLRTLLSSSIQDSANLTKKDVLVLVAGTNEVISDSGVKELWHITQFANQNSQTNIILLTPSLRYDQVSDVYINDNIKKFSKKLGKYMKLNEHVTILDSPQNRDYFTRHGLHYNGFGKDIICSQLALSIKNLFQHIKTPPISLGWEDKPPVLVEIIAPGTCNEPSKTVPNVVEENSKLNEHNTYRTSTRRKKLPVNRTDDFLW